MGSFTFRPAVREQTSVLVALAGPSGSGKSFSAMRIARGLVGADGKIAYIDTEAGRALHYADKFRFDHGDLRPPFRPEVYADAIAAADVAGYKAIVIDSMTHEHAGTGGVLEWHEEELQRMAGDDYGKRERMKFAAWIKPKQAHKRMMARLLQTRAHLIFCLRAEPKIELVKNDQGKTIPTAKGFQPICDSQFMYEMTVSFLLTPDHPGVGQPIKLQDQHKPCFPAGSQLDETAGERLAAWARGGAPAKAPETPVQRPLPSEPPTGGPVSEAPASGPAWRLIKADGKVERFPDREQFAARLRQGLAAMPDLARVDAFRKRNSDVFLDIAGADPEAGHAVEALINERLTEVSL